MPEWIQASCPYCGEPIELAVDLSALPATYIEDCPVCCHPMRVEAALDGDHASVCLRTADE